MTFGIGSPGFDPFWCPPCPEATICNTMCIDPIDGPILFGLLFGSMMLALWYVRNQTDEWPREPAE